MFGGFIAIPRYIGQAAHIDVHPRFDPRIGRGIQRLLKKALTDAGYVVDSAGDGEEGHFLGDTEPYDAVILDLGLPKINAELFAKIRTDKDGPEFDDAEAGMVIGRIERCAVANVERE